MTDTDLVANFENPPLVEVVIGLRFQPLNMHSPHIGLLWQQFQPEYPTYWDQPALIPEQGGCWFTDTCLV